MVLLAPFLAAAGLQLLTLLLTIFMLPESTTKDERSKVATLADIWTSLTHRTLSPLLIQLWAVSLALYAWFAVVTLLLKEGVGFTAISASFFFAAFGVISVLFQVLAVGETNDRLGARNTANLGIGCLLLGFLLVPLSTVC